MVCGAFAPFSLALAHDLGQMAASASMNAGGEPSVTPHLYKVTLDRHIAQWCPSDRADNPALARALAHGRNVTGGSLCLDVGSFDGSNAIQFARAACDTVLAFEPTPSKIERIQRAFNTSGMAQKLQLFPMAMANFSGKTSYWLANGDKGSQQDQLSQPKWGGSRHVEVPVDTLDNVVGDRAVLYAKIDAQGHDPEVLYGAEKLLQAKRIHVVSFDQGLIRV